MCRTQILAMLAFLATLAMLGGKMSNSRWPRWPRGPRGPRIVYGVFGHVTRIVPRGTLLVTACVFLLSGSLIGQEREIWAAGVSASPESQPSVAGSALWAKEMRESNNYLFVAADILPNNDRPATVLTNIGIGLADRVTTIGHRFPVFVPVTFDISATGNHTGWAWTGGAMVSIPFKQHWHLLPTVRILHSDLGGGAIQPIFTIMVGWEQ